MVYNVGFWIFILGILMIIAGAIVYGFQRSVTAAVWILIGLGVLMVIIGLIIWLVYQTPAPIMSYTQPQPICQRQVSTQIPLDVFPSTCLTDCGVQYYAPQVDQCEPIVKAPSCNRPQISCSLTNNLDDAPICQRVSKPLTYALDG